MYVTVPVRAPTTVYTVFQLNILMVYVLMLKSLFIITTLRYLSCHRGVGANFHISNARDCENTNYNVASYAGGDDTLMLEEASVEF